MATVAPVISTTTSVPCVVWSGIVTGDTITALTMKGQWGLAASVQISGTFGGATVKLQQSNDGTTWFDIKDVSGTTVSATANAMFEFSVSAVYLRPSIASGSANSVNCTVAFRGLT